MKIALIVTTEFKDYILLESKLDAMNITEVVSGTTNGFEMLTRYIETRPNIQITLAKSGRSGVMRSYNAINESDNVVIFANGNGKRTELSIANAINENKNLTIYSYKSEAFDIKTNGKYAQIKLNGNLQRSTKIDAICLNKEEVENLINTLTEVSKSL